jgi:hypothetical protein
MKRCKEITNDQIRKLNHLFTWMVSLWKMTDRIGCSSLGRPGLSACGLLVGRLQTCSLAGCRWPEVESLAEWRAAAGVQLSWLIAHLSV